MIDIIGETYDLLTTSARPLSGLIDTRAWSPVAPVSFRNDAPAIVYSAFADMHSRAASVIEVRLLFKCYGGSETYSDARSVAIALVELLDGNKTEAFHFVEVESLAEYREDVYPCYVVQAVAWAKQ